MSAATGFMERAEGEGLGHDDDSVALVLLRSTGVSAVRQVRRDSAFSGGECRGDRGTGDCFEDENEEWEGEQESKWE